MNAVRRRGAKSPRAARQRVILLHPRRFGVPIDAWLRGPLRDWAEGLLSERRLAAEGILDPAMVREKWAQHLGGRVNHQYLLWDVLMFQAWHERWG